MKLLFRALLALALLSLAAPSAFAQATTSYTLTVFNGTTTVSTTVINAANFVCGQTPPPTPVPPVLNPRHAWFQDPANATLACIFTDNGTNGPLSSLPNGPTTYTAELLATNSAGSSAESAASNSFTEPGQVAAVPVAVKVGP